ncbi:MAG: hypothetical protein N3I86_13980 [Verrucomicrobiae bacterium]|nr:hypothetical protein [Verrucomicrobiae bacterium]MDW8309673.1 hypothetical protein [Verrucomicrobiales bacterium]
MNRLGARYLVVGGFAIIEAGFLRTTVDIDLLIEASPDNERKVFEALRCLPDQAVQELNPGDVERFVVVRVCDEVVVDLMKRAGGLDYAEAIRDAEYHEVNGVRVPFASPQTLWRMKQTHREKDIPDRLFLRKLLEARGVPIEETPKPPAGRLRRWLERLFGGSR